MDDMYQYAASAVNKEQKPSSVAEEDDVILKAFNNMGWGKKWSSLVDTVKKQSEAFVEGTKKDLQEFAQVLIEDDDPSTCSDSTTTINEDGSVITSRPTEEEDHDVVLEAIRENLAKINTVHFASLRDGLTHTLNTSLPSQITNVRLPENMDLAQLKEGLANGTRSAEHYLQKFGTDVISALKNTVTVLAPEQQQQQQQEEDVKNEKSPRIFASRKEALIAKMQTNEKTYLNEPELSKKDQEDKILTTFNSSFHIEEYTDEIAQLLNDYPHLRETMDRLVPIQVSYALFWQRYFYHTWKIDQDEQKRQLIVKGVDEEAEDFKWDSDEEDNNTPSKPNQLATSSSTTTITTKKVFNKQQQQQQQTETETETVEEGGRPSTSNSDDTDDFSNISEPIESPPLKSSQTTEDEWVKTDEKHKKNSQEEQDDQDDSDSDWE